MNRTRKAWIGVALAALIAPAAVVATLSGPASADADGKHRHDLDTYKREAWVALGGAVDPASVTLSMLCDTGDYALDGMWKVDAHDGDDRTVRAEYSRRNSGIKEQWDFKLINGGAGRAQVKTFVTCLDGTTGERDGHTHTLVAGSPANAAPATVVGTISTLTATCASGIPVSPSFGLAPGDTAVLVESYPSGSPEVTTWTWVFEGTGTPVATIYCISRTTSGASLGFAHTHDIDADLLKLDDQAVGIGEQTDFRLFARPHDEGNVGAFRIENPATSTVAYLGQDAQGQVRGFRFGNPNPGAVVSNVDLAVWGFDKRTKKNS